MKHEGKKKRRKNIAPNSPQPLIISKLTEQIFSQKTKNTIKKKEEVEVVITDVDSEQPDAVL